MHSTPSRFTGRRAARISLAAALLSGTVLGATLEFQLLTWTDVGATAELPSAVGRKPSAPFPMAGDWLVFTPDDALLAAGNNPVGAVSHNLVDLTGAGGAAFNLAPSLSGMLTLALNHDQGSNWAVSVTALAYSGQANAMQAMNQFLVSPGSPATTNAAYSVDGLGNAGRWTAGASRHWAIQYALDFYFATSADGDPSATDIDATFDDKVQTGYLIPVNQLTASALDDVVLDDPAGFHVGNFKQYLLEQIQPRLPANATYLLLTQMAKTHPDYAEPGLPITTAGLVGNTTVAYTTQTLAETPRLLSLRLESGQAILRFTGLAGRRFEIERSANLGGWETITNPALAYPEMGIVEWIDPAPDPAKQFYRVLVLTP